MIQILKTLKILIIKKILMDSSMSIKLDSIRNLKARSRLKEDKITKVNQNSSINQRKRKVEALIDRSKNLNPS